MSALIRAGRAWRLVGSAAFGAALAALSACSGGGGSSGDAASPAPADESPGPAPPPPAPAWVQVQRWDFNSAEDWQFQAEPSNAASVQVQDGGLQLQAALYFDANQQVLCPLAAAQVLLTDARITGGSLSELVLDLDVSRWNLGLGRFDNDVPRLELVIGGQRHQLRVAGFAAMPGKLKATWTPDAGFSFSIDGVANLQGASTSADAGPPLVRLWIDGCSQGMSQALTVDALTVSVR